MSLRLSSLVLGLTLGAYDSAALAQEMPAEYASVMTALGKKGDYLGTGPAERLARGVRAAVDVLGKPRPTAH